MGAHELLISSSDCWSVFFLDFLDVLLPKKRLFFIRRFINLKMCIFILELVDQSVVETIIIAS